MKTPNASPATRARKALACGLAAMLTVSYASGQTTDADALRQLQEENAALRKRLAEVEGQAQPAAATAPATTPGAPAAAPGATPASSEPPADPNTLVLSPFQVNTEKDFGYLKTNSSTATRIGTEIQKVPLSISVISEDFIKDTAMKDIQDVLRYQASSAGDGRMGILQPATGFTPSGIMTLRGFPINSRLRNGLLRYNAYNLDNVERVEVIKGPAAVFFGNAFPGGVINYITKQPVFADIPTEITYAYSGYDNRIGGERVTFDTNQAFSDKAAVRVVGAWDNAIGDQRFEYQKGYSLNAGLTLSPLKSGRLKIALEGEVLQRKRNMDDNSYIWPTQWLDDYKAPPADLLALTGLSATAYQARIFNNVGQWIADKRNAAGDQTLPLYTSVSRGALITDMNGNLVQDEKFNYYGVGTYSEDNNSTFSAVTDFTAASWLDLRYSFTNVQSRFDRKYSQAGPYADGRRFNANAGAPLYQGYEIDAQYHQFDSVFKADFAGIKNKILVGGLYGTTYNSYYGSTNHANIFPAYGYLPGAYDKPDEGYVSPIPAAFRHPVTGWGVNQQYVRDRFGKILTPQEIFTQYDPGFHMSPDVGRITEVTRGLIDHSRPTREEWYVNWQGTMLQDRLTTFLGYRKEKTKSVGQIVAVNPPWYSAPENALEVIPPDQWIVYGLSPIFSRPNPTEGDSKMAGASFEITKNVNVYASYSETFLPSGVRYLGGDYDPNAVTTRAILLGLDPVAENARIVQEGGLNEVSNEKGKNAEIGVKLALDDNKIVGTFSLFQVTRENRVLDDSMRQAEEPLNYILPNKGGTYSATNRVVRWYTASAKEQTEGLEGEVIWSPIRNYQMVVSGSWMWKAELVEDPSLAITPKSTPAQILQNEISFSSRLINAPEYRFNIWNKYTFDQNFAGNFGRGLSLGLGMRYSSEMNIQNNVNFWGAKGGLTAGDYVVFDTVITYPFEVLGYKMYTTLNVSNLTDREYLEGNYNLAEPRAYKLTLGMEF